MKQLLILLLFAAIGIVTDPMPTKAGNFGCVFSCGAPRCRLTAPCCVSAIFSGVCKVVDSRLNGIDTKKNDELAKWQPAQAEWLVSSYATMKMMGEPSALMPGISINMTGQGRLPDIIEIEKLTGKNFDYKALPPLEDVEDFECDGGRTTQQCLADTFFTRYRMACGDRPGATAKERLIRKQCRQNLHAEQSVRAMATLTAAKQMLEEFAERAKLHVLMMKANEVTSCIPEEETTDANGISGLLGNFLGGGMVDQFMRSFGQNGSESPSCLRQDFRIMQNVKLDNTMISLYRQQLLAELAMLQATQQMQMTNYDSLRQFLSITPDNQPTNKSITREQPRR